MTAPRDSNCHNCGMTVDSAVPSLVAERDALREEAREFDAECNRLAELLNAEQDAATALREQVAELAGALRDLLPIAEAFRDAQPSSSIAFTQACEVLAPARVALARGEL